MNEVGKDGRGESVWLGWFLCDVLSRFGAIAAQRGDLERVKRYAEAKESIRRACEEQAWDGNWYRRAYFDDGTPLGSSTNSECRIDSLAQSWAVMSQVGDRDRAERGMASVYSQLVDEEARIILLLTPAFDKGDLNPGYIKGYLPGLRENGAQYTHAATWVVLATTMLGRGAKAFELFQLLNPITHGRTADEVQRYQGEPYVLCGDVYSSPQHRGRAGWSWYTGSSGWMFRIGIENILGLRRTAAGLKISPCIPKDWKSYRVRYRTEVGSFNIEVRNPHGKETGVGQIRVNGMLISGDVVPFPPAGDTSTVDVVVELS
jgi:cellobiose phosphorylase